MNNIAIVGNPNTVKTSLFNMITGSYEYVGNWAGVTVKKKVGALRSKQAQITDLPRRLFDQSSVFGQDIH